MQLFRLGCLSTLGVSCGTRVKVVSLQKERLIQAVEDCVGLTRRRQRLVVAASAARAVRTGPTGLDVTDPNQPGNIFSILPYIT